MLRDAGARGPSHPPIPGRRLSSRSAGALAGLLLAGLLLLALGTTAATLWLSFEVLARTSWPRALQLALVALAIGGAMVLVHPVVRAIVRPVERLRSMADAELSLLYDSAAFLQQRQAIEPMSAGFIERIIAYVGADAGAVRLVETRNDKLHLVAQQGPPQCGREGFATLSVFQIVAQGERLGVFSLHFRAEHRFDARETALLETLGRLLGAAIENVRLAAREREMAVSEERNMVARGLHDSIAQGLNFLNLQVQMLEESLRHGRQQEAADIVPLLRAGVQESYQDVRELLQNFRSRLEEDDLTGALRKAVRKFEDQTGVGARFAAEGPGGPPFAREDQLQILFIVQEALSNIRKHAHADHVLVRVRDGQDFSLSISDNGVGFDAAAVSAAREAQVGLHIMRERALRIHADLAIESRAGAGATVRLLVPSARRRAA